MTDGLRVAVVGLEFGAEFVPIYRDHPLVAEVAVADLDPVLTARVGDRFGVDHRFSGLDAVLGSGAVDAVHLVTGLDRHADQVVAALAAGVHVACTVPMGLSFDDLARIVDARRRSRGRYMMMETSVYTREFLLAQDMMRRGEFGSVRYARGAHFQDMTDWPDYWLGLPPMHYATHAVAPVLRLLDATPGRVRAIGAGPERPDDPGAYGNPFSVESAILELRDHPAIVEITRSLTHVARPYTEAFSIYGDRSGFEWPQLEHEEDPLVFEMAAPGDGRGRPISARRVRAPDRGDLLPEPLRRYTTRFVHQDEPGTHLSFLQGNGHGGSHPHLVHEFVSSIVDDRAPAIDEHVAAAWTGAGIAAHVSAMAGGEAVEVPEL